MKPSPSKLAAATLLSSSAISNAALYNQVISTQYGAIQGYPAFNSSPQADLTHWKDITVWKGIPFAASTAGNNRFKPPQPAAAWNSTLYAKDFGLVCPAATSGSEYSIGEDCLNLNVWSAANSTNASLPVVVSMTRTTCSRKMLTFFVIRCGATQQNQLPEMRCLTAVEWLTKGLCLSTTITEQAHLDG